MLPYGKVEQDWVVSAHLPPLTETVVCQLGHLVPVSLVVKVLPYCRPKAKHFLTTWLCILSVYWLFG